MASPARPFRILWIIAVGFLALDALLMALAAVWQRRPGLFVWSALLAGAAAVAAFSWRRYTRHLAELRQHQQLARTEIDMLRRALREPNAER